MNKNRGLLLDRDGVINVDHGFVGTIERCDFMSGIFPFARAARDLGYRLAIVTNQAGVARGLYTEKDYAALMDYIGASFLREGVEIALMLGCFEYEGSDIPRYARQSFWRKPNPGMPMEAVRRLNLDPARSVMVGDRASDMEAAKAAGIGRALWLGGTAGTMPDVEVVGDLAAALKALSA